jgi:hypothetical protein
MLFITNSKTLQINVGFFYAHTSRKKTLPGNPGGFWYARNKTFHVERMTDAYQN